MRTIRDALFQYITVRRALGANFREPAVTLGHFVTFLEEKGVAWITTDLALRWACQSAHVQRATWVRRLGMVRGFASWLSAFDPRTEEKFRLKESYLPVIGAKSPTSSRIGKSSISWPKRLAFHRPRGCAHGPI